MSKEERRLLTRAWKEVCCKQKQARATIIPVKVRDQVDDVTLIIQPEAEVQLFGSNPSSQKLTPLHQFIVFSQETDSRSFQAFLISDFYFETETPLMTG